MSLKFYMDVHIPRSITTGLRLRNVDVLTAQDDAKTTAPDSQLIERATKLNRVVVTFDDDFLFEATKRQQLNIPFSGIIYGHQLHVTVGSCVNDLEILSKVAEPADLRNRVEFLPL
jgi:hypothetical protein